MNLSVIRAGPLLWAGVSLVAFFLLVEQLRRFLNKQPYRSQPVQGARYAVLAGHLPSISSQLLLPLLIQVFCFLGLLLSLVSVWGSMGGISRSLFNCDFRMPFRPQYDYYNRGYTMLLRADDGFTVVASNWTTALFGLLSQILNVCQIIAIFKLRRPVMGEPAQQAMVLGAKTPGVWARAYLLLVLHYAMIVLYGVLVCAWGGLAPSSGFYTALLVTLLQRLQSNLIAEFITSLPPPHPGGVVGFPQCIPDLHQPGLAAAQQPRRGEVEMNVVQAQPMIQPGQNPYYSLPQGPPVPANWPAVSAPAYYHPQAPTAYAAPVALHVNRPIENAPLLASATIASRVCGNCNTFATGAGVFCSACGNRL